MAQTYSYCNGETRVDVSITATVGSITYNRQYEETYGGSPVLVTETYKKMTFTAASVPAEDLFLTVNFQTAVVWDSFTTTPTNYAGSSMLVTFPAGQTTYVIDVPITKAYCYNYSSYEEYGI